MWRLILFSFLFGFQNLFAQHDGCLGESIAKCRRGEGLVFANQHLEYRGDQSIDIGHYRLEVEIDPAQNYIAGKNTLFFRATQALSRIELDLSADLSISSIHGQNFPGLSFGRIDQNKIGIELGKTMTLNQIDSIEIVYEGEPSANGFGSYVISTHGQENIPVAWSLSEPFGASDWWPCKNDLSDKADSVEIRITCPLQYRGASNGSLYAEFVEGLKRTSVWKHKYPITAYLVAFAITDYAILRDSITLAQGKMEYLQYVYPESIADAQSGTLQLKTVLTEYEKLVGNYPFWREKYGHAQFGWGGGMEHQTMSFVVNFGFELLAHELAHQWFGDKVTCGSWQDIWLNEGFATYMSGLAYEKVLPQFYKPFLNVLRNNVISQPGGSVFVSDTTSVNRIFDSRLVYRKGAYLLHMLRWKMGDIKFFNGLKAYLEEPGIAYNYARVDQFKRVMERESGLMLSEFFSDWYYNQGYPNYTGLYEYIPTQNRLNFKLDQSQSHGSVSFYEMPVPIVIKKVGQKDTTFVLDHKNAGQIFSFQLNYEPDSILIDPEMWILKGSSSVAKGVFTKVEAIEPDFPFQLYPNPAHQSIQIINSKLNNIDSKIVKYSIIDQTSRIVASDEYKNERIDIGFLANGIFTILISTDKNKTYIARFIKIN